MNFYSPLSFLFLLGLIPIILMYLLKKQHKEMEVSSTFLWERTIRDIEANTPWQRLRKNLLLLLQLLIFTIIAIALTKPFIFSGTVDAQNLIVVLDKSASMQTTDAGESRFDTAKSEIEDLFGNMNPQTQITFITMGNKPQVSVSKSGDKKLLMEKLDEVKVTNDRDNLKDTISLIRAITKDMEGYKILFYTDKGIDYDIENIVVKHMGGNGVNSAIENISHSRDQGGLNILTTVTNYWQSQIEGDLILYTDDNMFEVREIAIGPNETQNVYWKGIPDNVNIIKAELDIEDDLLADNIRYHVVNSNPINKVLLTTDGNVFLERAITLSSSVELYKSNEALENVEGYDLYVYDGIIPKDIPTDGNILYFNPSEDNNLVEIVGNSQSGELKLNDDELFKYVDLDFSAREVKLIKNPKWGIPVLTSDSFPVLIKGQRGNQRVVVAGFDLHDTDFPLKIGFPIFVQNLLDYTLNINNQSETSILAGNNIEISPLPKATEVVVTRPNGVREKVGPPFPLPPYGDTQDTGVYTIEQSFGEESYTNYFVSNIDTEGESNIGVRNDERDNNVVNEEQNQVKTGKDMTFILLVLALIFLFIEWMVYNRGY